MASYSWPVTNSKNKSEGADSPGHGVFSSVAWAQLAIHTGGLRAHDRA